MKRRISAKREIDWMLALIGRGEASEYPTPLLNRMNELYAIQTEAELEELEKEISDVTLPPNAERLYETRLHTLRESENQPVNGGIH